MKCVVCGEVLKKAIQVVNCGHRYCTACYNQCYKYANHLKVQLTCPLDGEVVGDKVFEDTAIDREINNLQVNSHFDVLILLALFS